MILRNMLCTGKAGEWGRTLQIFDELQSQGIVPDLIAYNTAIHAAGKQAYVYMRHSYVVCKLQKMACQGALRLRHTFVRAVVQAA